MLKPCGVQSEMVPTSVSPFTIVNTRHWNVTLANISALFIIVGNTSTASMDVKMMKIPASRITLFCMFWLTRMMSILLLSTFGLKYLQGTQIRLEISISLNIFHNSVLKNRWTHVVFKSNKVWQWSTLHQRANRIVSTSQFGTWLTLISVIKGYPGKNYIMWRLKSQNKQDCTKSSIKSCFFI